jgi:hypothetical protein
VNVWVISKWCSDASSNKKKKTSVAAYELKTGALYPATFHDKGPDIGIRCASHFSSACEVHARFSFIIICPKKDGLDYSEGSCVPWIKIVQLLTGVSRQIPGRVRFLRRMKNRK